MGLMDAVSSLVNAVTGGGGGSSSGTGTPVWRKGDPYLLCSSLGSGAGQVAPNNTNQFNLQGALVFLHYGRFHLDSTADFSGAKSSGSGAGSGSGSLNRGVLFRDCLIREAILLHGLIFSTRAMMQQYSSEKGWMGEASAAVGMVSNLLGGGGPPAPKPPDPDQLDKLMQRVKDATAKFNVTPVKYPDLNIAGQTLHQIRADYGLFLDQLADFYVAPPSSSQGGSGGLAGVMGTVTGAINKALLYIPIIGQFANAFTKIAEVLPVMHLTAAWALEQGLADQSYALSMSTLQPEQAVPKTTFPLWDNASSTSGSGSAAGTIGDTPLNQALSILSAGDTARKSQDDALLASLGSSGGSGGGQLKTLKAQFYKRCRQWYPPPDALAHAFIRGTGITDIPGLQWGGAALQGLSSKVSSKIFQTCSSSGGGSASGGGGGSYMERFLAKRVSGMIDFVKDVYLAIHQQPTATIDANFLRKVGTDALVDMILGMVQDIVSTPALPTDPTGMLSKLNPKSMFEDWLYNKNDKWVNQAINYLIVSTSNSNSMLSILQEAQKTAKASSGLTMEVYLSRLPWIVTTMFHQTFFSVFAKLLEETAGKGYSTIVNQLTWVRGMNSKIDNEAQSLSGTANKYSSLAGGAGSGLSGLLSQSGIGGILSKITGIVGVTGPSFPFDSRVSGGKANAVTADDLSSSGVGTSEDFPASGSGSASGYYLFNSSSGAGTPTPDKHYPAFPGGAGSHPSSGSGSGAGSGSGSATGPAGLYGLPF
jgi:hypothetical protein